MAIEPSKVASPDAETLRKVRNAVMAWQRGEKTPERTNHFMASIATIVGKR